MSTARQPYSTTHSSCPDWCDLQDEPGHDGDHYRWGTYVPASRGGYDRTDDQNHPDTQGAMFPTVAAHLRMQDGDGPRLAIHVSVGDTEISLNLNEAIAFLASGLAQVGTYGQSMGQWLHGDAQDIDQIAKYADILANLRGAR